ncbi:MAG: hypothetical protein HQK53_00365 [Oligoflexia bacterium]|nr:hypothetical protein [Oligoflexia bacterium]
MKWMEYGLDSGMETTMIVMLRQIPMVIYLSSSSLCSWSTMVKASGSLKTVHASS